VAGDDAGKWIMELFHADFEAAAPTLAVRPCSVDNTCTSDADLVSAVPKDGHSADGHLDEDGGRFLWSIELLNEEDGQWYDGKAFAYNAGSGEIAIDIESQGLEGEVPLDFSSLRLVACGDEHSRALFAGLMKKQWTWLQKNPTA
jgi:hypothetical protein